MEPDLTYNSVSSDTKKSSHAIPSVLNIPNTHHPIFHPAQCPPSILLRLVHRPPPITIYPALPNHLNYLAQDLASFILIDSITIRPISRVASFHAATLTDHVAFRSRSPSSPIACHRPIPNPPSIAHSGGMHPDLTQPGHTYTRSSPKRPPPTSCFLNSL